MTQLAVHPVTAHRWPDMVELFARRGPRGGHRNVPAYGCWCMYWRDRTLEHGEAKRRAMASIVRRGPEPGLLAYEEGEPVGWVSVAPREEFRALLASPQYRPRDDDEGVWSIVCFAVDRYAQRRGVAGALLDAAVAHACRRGAAQIEAYPHVSNASDYMGVLDAFVARGFRPFREKSKRTIVRRAC